MKFYWKRFLIIFATSSILFATACDEINPVCGNGKHDEGEPCEPGIEASGCIEAGYWGGEPTCMIDCHRDYTSCERIIDIQPSGSNSCALSNKGKVYCWGEGGNGINGDGTNEKRLSPVNVNFGISQIVQISFKGDHVCVLDMDGYIACWGDNTYGQLGDGTFNSSNVPKGIYRSTESKFIYVSTTGPSSFAIDETGQLWHWGDIAENEMGLCGLPTMVKWLRRTELYQAALPRQQLAGVGSAVVSLMRRAIPGAME